MQQHQLEHDAPRATHLSASDICRYPSTAQNTITTGGKGQTLRASLAALLFPERWCDTSTCSGDAWVAGASCNAQNAKLSGPIERELTGHVRALHSCD
jgi:hypothetical protein